jgi:hypothetical protein
MFTLLGLGIEAGESKNELFTSAFVRKLESPPTSFHTEVISARLHRTSWMSKAELDRSRNQHF